MSILFKTKLVTFCLLLLVSTTGQAQTSQLTIEQPEQSSVTYELPENIRLGDAISRALPNKSIYWPAARLGSEQLQQELERERRKVLMQLEDLEAYAKRQNNQALRGAAVQVYKQIEKMPLKAAYYLGIPWEKLRIEVESNPKLNETAVENSHFVLSINTYPTSYRLLGLTNAPESKALPSPESPVTLVSLLAAQKLNPVADNGHVWQITTNGEVSYQPAASYNAKQASQCYAHEPSTPLQLGSGKQCFPNSNVKGGAVVFIGFAQAELPEAFKNINKHIAQLIKHHNYAQN